MYEECELISSYKKKLKVDPDNANNYENMIWKHSARVTDLNNSYNKEKDTPII